MTPPIRPEIDLIEKELAAMRTPVDVDAELAAMVKPRHGPAQRVLDARRRAREAINAAEKEDSFTEGDRRATAINTAFDDASFGGAGLVVDALSPGSFTTNRDARRALRERLPASDRALAAVAGGLANPLNYVAPLGVSGALLGAPARTAGALKIVGRGMIEGAAQGGAAVLGENVGTTDPYSDKVSAAVVGGAALGGFLAPAVTRLARTGRDFFDPIHQVLPDALGGGAAKARRLTELTERTAARQANVARRTDGIVEPTVPGMLERGRMAVASRMAEARQPGWTSDIGLRREVPVIRSANQPAPFPTAPSLAGGRTQEIDVAGPSMLSRARGATGSVEGRDVATRAFEARTGEMERHAAQTFDDVTGTTADDATNLAVEVADAQRANVSQNATQLAAHKAQVASDKAANAQARADARATVAPPAPPAVTRADMLRSLDEVAPTPNAIETGQALAEAKRTATQQVYGEANESTKGIAVRSQLLAEAQKSSMGRKAWEAIQRSRSNVVFGKGDPSRALPTTDAIDTPDGIIPESVEFDASAVHELKQLLSSWGRLNPEQAAALGVDAKDARSAGEAFDRVRDELNPLFRKADAVNVEHSARGEAVELGRTPWTGNPDPNSFTGNRHSVTVAKQRLAEMTTENRALAAEGKRFDIVSQVNAGKLAPEKAAEMLELPSSDLAQQVDFAYGEGASAHFANLWKKKAPVPFVKPVVPQYVTPQAPAPIPLPADSRAAVRGLDITRTPSVPSAAKPELSLPNLNRDVVAMAATERANLRRGAAADFRGELAQGKELNLDVPDRFAQFGHAAKSAGDATRMRSTVQAQADVTARQKAVLPATVIATEPDVGGFRGWFAKNASPWLNRFALNIFRDAVGESSKGTTALQSATDAQIIRWLNADAGTLEAELSRMSRQNGDAIRKVIQAVQMQTRFSATVGNDVAARRSP